MDKEQWQQFNTEALNARLIQLLDRLTGKSESLTHLSEHLDYPADFETALESVQRRFGLSDFETDCLFLCAAMEYDLEIAELCASSQQSASRRYPTPSLCMQTFDAPAWDFLSPERPLRKYNLVEMIRYDAVPQMASPMFTDPRIVNFIRGLDHCDERLGWHLQPTTDPTKVVLSLSQIESIDEALLTESLDSPSIPPLRIGKKLSFQLTGSDSNQLQMAAHFLADKFELPLRRLIIESIPTQVDELDVLTKTWNREIRLSPSALQIELSSSVPESQLTTLASFLARIEGLVIVTARDKVERLPGTAVEIRLPTTNEQKQAWLTRISNPAISQRLAGQFDLGLNDIDRIARETLKASSSTENPADFDLAGALWTGCCRSCRPRLKELAQRIDSKATWGDLVVPIEQLSLLKQIVNQVRCRSKVLDEWGFRNRLNRGFGITALFAGESGTGKTMAAEVIANDLNLDLYRIDLSSVVNKYIGETEKNLRRLFDAAENGGAILFFDEADALFGKRSEVKDSHDRYANIEVNYLLQRLESFRGLVILASNNKTHMDSAFLRRLRFVVDFAFPDANQRNEIWRRVFPQETPLSGFDSHQLAKLGIPGGNIHNIALNAAYAAAAHDCVDMTTLLLTAKSELIKTQRALTVPGVHWPTQAGPIG